MTRNTRQAVRRYGLLVCLRAMHLNVVDGEGASTIGFYLGLTTNQADAAISAGMEIRRSVLLEYLHQIEYDPSVVVSVPQYSRSNTFNDPELRHRGLWVSALY